MKTTRNWIVVADGARARFYLSEGWNTGLKAALPRDEIAPHPPTREIGSDRPGRAHESADTARHAMEPRVDWHEFEKHLFAKEVAGRINAAATANEFERLVLVAPPRVLGDLRAGLNKAARERLAGEIDKDLTKLDEADLVRRIEEVVPV